MAKKFPSKLAVAYFATWDERSGPIIVDCYPPMASSPDLDFENITLQIFTSLQTVFGNDANVKFDRTNLVIPLKSVKRLAKILLNSIPNSKVRGGFLPILTVFLLPLEYPEEHAIRFNPLQDKILQSYSRERSIKMERFYPEMSNIIDEISKDLRQQGDKESKQRQNSKAITHYETAELLLDSINKSMQARFFRGDLNYVRSKRAYELAQSAKENVKRAIVEQPFQDINEAIIIAEKTDSSRLINDIHRKANKVYSNIVDIYLRQATKAEQDSSFQGEPPYPIAESIYLQAYDVAKQSNYVRLFRKTQKIIENTYSHWAEDQFKKGKGAIRHHNFVEAHHFLTKAATLAKKSYKTRLTKKIQDTLGKIPNP
jgi:hypothetical protein